MRDFEALLAYIDDRSKQPFVWGRRANDCVSFAAGAVEAMTRRDLRLPEWSSQAGARRVLRRLGGLAEAVDTVLTRVPLAQAQRGDVAAVETLNGPVLTVVMGDRLVGPSATGLLRLPRSRASIAWSAE